ncbi:rho GTPase-activating protein 11A-like isoform X2 [Cimex lectularius]|uniref:Rho-GAP domain-containing protein n=1 Tax=Cimex lectularius TaxID=79782 RepID=A0A8I6SL97_CIMLE|nr:rho GTPase-activating protein 11A-like isoform X2 [Cimex lectularius]
MYLEECAVADVREEVVKLLKLLGIKHNLKKADYKPQGETQIEVYHVFKTALELLEKESVLLPQSGVQVEIPVFIIDSCRFIEQNLLVEGLFRKAGSTSKQRELRALLDCGNRLEITDEHHVINVANLLKLFFRELPEPLIPYKFHNTFLRCLSLKQKKVEAILLCCLLLPTDHLNALAYLLVFLNRVTQQKDFNKMDVGNLAIIFTPNVMPVNAPKLTAQGSVKINRHVLIVQTLIENATLVGVLPEAICDKLGYLNVSTSSTVDMDMSQNVSIKKRRKRRSNSLTKMISGFKKIMSKSSPDFTEGMDSPVPNLSAHTPKLILSRKRKNESQGFSSKKKCEMIDMLPGKVILPNTPFKIKYSSTTMLTPRTLISSFKHGSPPQKHKIKHLQPTANPKCTKKNNAAMDMASRKCKNVENKVCIFI